MKPHRTYRGSEHRNAKLTEDQARAILQAKGSVKGIALAAKYGVSPSSIREIWLRRNWKHIHA